MHIKMIFNSFFRNAFKGDKRTIKALWQTIISQQLSISTVGWLTFMRDSNVKK